MLEVMRLYVDIGRYYYGYRYRNIFCVFLFIEIEGSIVFY